MAEQTSRTDHGAVFRSSLLDASGQPDLIIPDSHALIWTLVNNATGSGQDLVVKPFISGKVGPEQYHFMFGFTPGALTDPPTLKGWDVAVQNGNGGIKSLFIALSGNMPLTIPPNGANTATFTYTKAVQKDPSKSKVAVTLTAGSNVTLAGTPITGKTFGPFDLNLLPANTPALSAPPLSLDFVGRRTVLNDGKTFNGFTFALTNMTEAPLTLTPKGGGAKGSPTVISVWFDAAPKQTVDPYPWALAKIEDLDSEDVVLTPPSSDWSYTKTIAKAEVIPGNPQWDINVSKAVELGPQDPVFFKFSGIKTDLAPGVTRMYLRYENLSGFHNGVLIAELEKTPLLYSATRGQGLYLSAGTPKVLPAPNYDSGLYVNQFGNAPAATFNGGETTATDTVVQLTNSSPGGKAWEFISSAATNSAGAGKLLIQESTHPVATFQSDGIEVGSFNTSLDQHLAVKVAGGSKYIAGIKLRALWEKVGFTIEYNDAKRALQILRHWGGDPIPALEIEADTGNAFVYGNHLTIGTDVLVVAQDKVTTSKPLTVTGKIAGDSLTVGNHALDVSDGKVGIGVTTPGFPLSFSDNLGDKISLWGQSGASYGFGIQASVLQIHTDSNYADIVFGSGSSSNFSETMRIKGNGNLELGGASQNPIMFSLGYTGFPNFNNNAEISNDISTSYGKALMLHGNSSRKIGGPRWVQVWDNLEVNGDLFVKGKATIYLADYGGWYSLGWRSGNNYVWWDSVSDLRFKREVQPVPSAIDKIRRLHGVTFRWNEDALQHFTRDIETTISAGPNATERENQEVWHSARDRRRNQLATTHVGVVAQDVEAVLPEAVTTDAEGYKSVRYDNLIPLLIEAIKEQDRLVARQQAEIERLKLAVRITEPPPK
jgi:Chaperone of endosialidase